MSDELYTGLARLEKRLDDLCRQLANHPLTQLRKAQEETRALSSSVESLDSKVAELMGVVGNAESNVVVPSGEPSGDAQDGESNAGVDKARRRKSAKKTARRRSAKK